MAKWIYSNLTLNSRALVFHPSTPSLFPSALHLSPASFNLPPLSLLPSFIPPLFPIPHCPPILFILNPTRAIIISLSFPFSLIIFILSSVAVYILHVHPTIHSALLTCIDPFIHPCLSPFMCLPLVKKQHRSQILQPLTCRCFVFLFLPHDHKHFDLAHTYKDSLETHTSTHN